MRIRGVEELDLKDKRVFVRVDFNVPIKKGDIAETHRIDSALPTLRRLSAKARKVMIASHLGRPEGRRDPKWSLAPVRGYLERALSLPVVLAPDCIGPEVEALAQSQDHKVILLENLRFHKEEEENDPLFSRALAFLADAYVNDAFGAAHRAHASIEGMTRFLREKGAGLLFLKELDYLGRVLSNPGRPFAVLLGGAKVSDKIGVLKNLMPKVDVLLIGGGMAYTFLKVRGASVGRSLVEEDRIPLARELLAQAENLRIPVLLPVDHIAGPEIKGEAFLAEADIPQGCMGLDIGPKTLARFQHELLKAAMVLWNGPVGVFEEERFSHGTRSIAEILAEHHATTVVAGGDTVAAVMQAGVQNKMAHLSTGGGATLEFLEGKKLPGVRALEEQP